MPNADVCKNDNPNAQSEEQCVRMYWLSSCVEKSADPPNSTICTQQACATATPLELFRITTQVSRPALKRQVLSAGPGINQASNHIQRRVLRISFPDKTNLTQHVTLESLMEGLKLCARSVQNPLKLDTRMLSGTRHVGHHS